MFRSGSVENKSVSEILSITARLKCGLFVLQKYCSVSGRISFSEKYSWSRTMTTQPNSPGPNEESTKGTSITITSPNNPTGIFSLSKKGAT